MTDEDSRRKLDRHLVALLDDPGRQADTVLVVIRLRLKAAEGGTPDDKARDFERRTRPIVEQLEALGGVEIVELLWIANAIAARIAVPQLPRAAAGEGIAEMISDHPRRAL